MERGSALAVHLTTMMASLLFLATLPAQEGRSTNTVTAETLLGDLRGRRGPLTDSSDTVTVKTLLGDLRGRRGPLADSFHNIPYAAPPIGDKRFAPAAPQKPWYPKELDATGEGNAISCWQSGSADNTGINWNAGRKVEYKEDCLTLDIYRPAGADASSPKKLPVLLFIHGGGFTQGAAFESNGTWVANSQQVLVAFLNYRLGPLGFLVSEELSMTAGGSTGGMNGIMDQITAIRWLKAHAGAFGGDGARITVMGESSGGIATCTLALSPAVEPGLFNRAIVQSGPCIGQWGAGSNVYGLNLSKQVMAAVGASSLAELRQVPPGNISSWPDATYFGSQLFSGFFLDETVMPVPSIERLMEGKLNVKTLVIGSNTKDGTSQFYANAQNASLGVVPPWNASAAEYEAALLSQYGSQLEAVQRQYPLDRFGGSASSAFLQTVADSRLFCPSRQIASLASQAAQAFVYTFAVGPRFNDFLSYNQTGYYLVPPDVTDGFASHANDVWFSFNGTSGVLLGDENISFPMPFSVEEQTLVKDMMGYWGSVATSADGHPLGRVSWPAFVNTDSGGSGAVLRLDLGERLAAAHDFKSDDCYFWESH